MAIRRKERRNRKPCIGLCFIAKLKKTSTTSLLVTEETVGVEQVETASVTKTEDIVAVEQEEDIANGNDLGNADNFDTIWKEIYNF